MRKLIRGLIVGMFVLAFSTTCFASALTDYQAVQVQVANLTAQVQQAALLAQNDPVQAQNYQVLQAQLAQAQQTMQALEAAAVQELQQQQAIQVAQQQQAQQAAALQAQQTAAIQAKQQVQQNTPAPAAASSASYIGNKNTKKFHYAGCSSVADMNPGNKVALSSRDEAISAGYVPCKRCNP